VEECKPLVRGDDAAVSSFTADTVHVEVEGLIKLGILVRPATYRSEQGPVK
jgi:hypothetical protein